MLLIIIIPNTLEINKKEISKLKDALTSMSFGELLS